MDSRPGHAYQAPSASDSRSPCPALNAAANHGYLYVPITQPLTHPHSPHPAYSPHSGRDITFLQLTHAISELYNLTYPLAVLLSLGGMIMCSSRFKLDLAALAAHNKIEHDASLVHHDLRDGDNMHVSPRLVDELLAGSTDGRGLTLADFARARARREARVPGGKLDGFHAGIAGGESALTVMVMGDNMEIGVDRAKIWFGDEKLPPGWVSQTTTVSLSLQVLAIWTDARLSELAQIHWHQAHVYRDD
jgi:hypothetical protein